MATAGLTLGLIHHRRPQVLTARKGSSTLRHAKNGLELVTPFEQKVAVRPCTLLLDGAELEVVLGGPSGVTDDELRRIIT